MHKRLSFLLASGQGITDHNTTKQHVSGPMVGVRKAKNNALITVKMAWNKVFVTSRIFGALRIE